MSFPRLSLWLVREPGLVVCRMIFARTSPVTRAVPGNIFERRDGQARVDRKFFLQSGLIATLQIICQISFPPVEETTALFITELCRKCHSYLGVN